jgi:hypothetical protein
MSKKAKSADKKSDVCSFCGRVHGPKYEDAPYVAGDKAVCADSWYDAMGKEIDEHPIGKPGIRSRGCH